MGVYNKRTDVDALTVHICTVTVAFYFIFLLFFSLIFHLIISPLSFDLSLPLPSFSFYLLSGSVWLEGWKSGMIENDGRMKKWEDRKDFNFPPFCLVGSEKVEGWKK